MRPVGDFELLTTAVDPRFVDTLSRPVPRPDIRGDRAKAGGGDVTTIDEAEKDLAKGDERKLAGQFKNAISSYRDAIAKAEAA